VTKDGRSPHTARRARSAADRRWNAPTPETAHAGLGINRGGSCQFGPRAWRHAAAWLRRNSAKWRAAVDFHSAIPRFESWRPSQPPRSLPRIFRLSEKWRHFRGLPADRSVSGARNRAFPTKGRFFRGESLLREFSISEILPMVGPETSCVFAETGSNSRAAGAARQAPLNSGATQKAAIDLANELEIYLRTHGKG
jgi:hypothetical protein